LCNVQVGNVVNGVVRRVEPYGAFVGLDGMKVSGLLHISNISRTHVENVSVSCRAEFFRIPVVTVNIVTLLKFEHRKNPIKNLKIINTGNGKFNDRNY
jgi:predicted RNA-binding protein with RPS1 domain